MDYPLGPEDVRFRDEVRAWLAEHVPAVARGTGPLPSLDTREGFEAHRTFERELAKARLSVVGWPERFGGRGASPVQELVFEEEYAAAGGPARVNQNGIYLLGPTLMTYGTVEQQERFLPPMARADEVWCQGWSEPDAGSDLLALRSRAERRGESYVIYGQKTWCSRGAFADWLFGLFRTDPDATRQRGLTFLLVPLRADGVHVRPIPQLDGEPGFAEVFFDGVEVGPDLVVGEPGQGFEVAMATAGSERGFGLRPPGRYLTAARRLVAALARALEEGRLEAYALLDAVARAVVDAEAYRLHAWAAAEALAEGRAALRGPEASAVKVFWSELDLAIREAAVALAGPAWQELDTEGEPTELAAAYMFALAGPIYAGTNEIQRTTLATRVLRLPREP
jgi:alkylation response protein AidB-like acyl-CoA dehydrogenase